MKALRRLHCQISTATIVSSTLSSTIVPDTAMPYAEARLVELLNPMTSAITAANNTQLTAGM